MSFWLYLLSLTSVALLSCGLTVMYFAQKGWRGERAREPQQWYWWVGYDEQLKKEFLIAAVGKDASEAQMLLGPKNFNLSMTARVQGGTSIDRPGRHVLVARSLSEINMEGN